MAEACIVCLGDLRSSPSEEEEEDPTTSPRSPGSASTPHRRTKNSRSRSPQTAVEDDEIIAHLLPCQHDLHNSCLKPWVERANSCPICRATFNQVELKQYLKGPTLSSYAVQDKRQEADVDPTLVIDDELFEEDDACLICGAVNNAYEVMFCDGCDRSVHVFCAGCHEAPDVWYCEECTSLLQTDGDLPLSQSTTRRPRRTRRGEAPPRANRRRTRRPDSDWARVWQTVWHNLNLDLDFPFDDQPAETRRTPAQRREFNAWQRRLRVANQQGAANRFRETASTLLERPPSNPESQEELRAWNAFDKARELQEEPTASNRRKRRTTTDSPASPREADQQPTRRPLKRPRTRRIAPPVAELPTQAESSNQAAARIEGPSFLTSLLQEVERQNPPSDQASPTSQGADDQTSAGPLSSPEGSPATSNFGSPRAGSITPPPLQLPRASYTPLTSVVRPLASPPFGAYSPFSPTEQKDKDHDDRGRRESRQSAAQRQSSPQSPTGLSFSTKAEIQRMVKTVLKPAYQRNEVDKDQYTDINRDVSRALYEQVGDASDLADHDSRERLQQLASKLVQEAIEALK